MGHGLRESVDGVLVAQPCLHLLVDPPGGVQGRPDDLQAGGIEHDPLELKDVSGDEIEECRAGFGLDVVLQGGEGGSAALEQLVDDGPVGVDQRGHAGNRPNDGIVGVVVTLRRDEVAACEHGLQRIADERIGSTQGLEVGGATRRRNQEGGHVDEQPASRLGHAPWRRHLPEGEPQRLHGVGHHLLMTDGDVEVVVLVVLHGDGEQRGDGSALDYLKAVVVEAPFDVLGLVEVRLDESAEAHYLDDLLVGQDR